MLPCSLNHIVNEEGMLRYNRQCFAIDIGSNFGLHTFSMLQLGAHVISIEPQTDPHDSMKSAWMFLVSIVILVRECAKDLGGVQSLFIR